MAANAAHHWLMLVLIASAAGEALKDPTTAGDATTIKLITAHPPLLTHPVNPSMVDWAAEEFPATRPYRATIAEGVLCQLNSCCSYTSKSLPLLLAQQPVRVWEEYRLQPRSTAWATSQATHTSRGRPQLASPARWLRTANHALPGGLTVNHPLEGYALSTIARSPR